MTSQPHLPVEGAQDACQSHAGWYHGVDAPQTCHLLPSVWVVGRVVEYLGSIQLLCCGAARDITFPAAKGG